MKKAQSRNLVIDASIARASGGESATYPTSMVARDLLKAVLTICHKIVMTSAIRAEWDEHQSGFSRKWRKSMVARKKLIALNIEERADIRERVGLEDINQADKNDLLKDCHLIEAALSTDKRIISLDNTARKLFVRLSGNVGDIRDILWIDPVSNGSLQVMTWLEGGQDGSKWRLSP